MAGAGAKKRLEENRQRVAVLRGVVFSGAFAFFLIRLVVFPYWGMKFSMWHWIGFALTCMVSWFTYGSIAKFAAAIYGPGGELLSGGADLSMKGACAYYHDLLYITSFVQVGICAIPVTANPHGRSACMQSVKVFYEIRPSRLL